MHFRAQVRVNSRGQRAVLIGRRGGIRGSRGESRWGKIGKVGNLWEIEGGVDRLEDRILWGKKRMGGGEGCRIRDGWIRDGIFGGHGGARIFAGGAEAFAFPQGRGGGRSDRWADHGEEMGNRTGNDREDWWGREGNLGVEGRGIQTLESGRKMQAGWENFGNCRKRVSGGTWEEIMGGKGASEGNPEGNELGLRAQGVRKGNGNSPREEREREESGRKTARWTGEVGG